MSNSIGKMTRDELRAMIGTAVEEKLLEMLGDPDQGQVLRKKLRTRLLRQQQAVGSGERGLPFKGVAQRLGLK